MSGKSKPMTNNDILRRIRYVFDFKDQEVIKIFDLAKSQITQEELINYFRQEEHPEYKNCSDKTLATFLNGLITKMRGESDGPKKEIEKKLDNNIIFKKLKIALNLKAEEVLDILKLVDFEFGKHELSALFRKKGHKHYRNCHDQVLRNFLNGLQKKYRS